MNYYLDTSALCKSYHLEIGSRHVEKILSEKNSHHFVSRLACVEIHSAFAIKVRRGDISAHDLLQLRACFHSDVKAKKLRVLRLVRRHFDGAEGLVLKYASRDGLRTLDALHLASAIDFRVRDSNVTFVCADGSLTRIAALEGLEVVDASLP